MTIKLVLIVIQIGGVVAVQDDRTSGASTAHCLTTVLVGTLVLQHQGC